MDDDDGCQTTLIDPRWTGGEPLRCAERAAHFGPHRALYRGEAIVWDAAGARLTCCSRCERPLGPGESIVSTRDPDPWRALQHTDCALAAELARVRADQGL